MNLPRIHLLVLLATGVPFATTAPSHVPSLTTWRISIPLPFFARQQRLARGRELFLAKSNKRRSAVAKRTRSSSSGFGVAAKEHCPCGSELSYIKCCEKLHTNDQAYANATAEAVVRARYSAYAKREVEFILKSTHPLNKDFMTDIEHWKQTIKNNCYDNFKLSSCKILSESYHGEPGSIDEVATVKFIATMTQIDLRKRTSFTETSSFERANVTGAVQEKGPWLYKTGLVEQAPV